MRKHFADMRIKTHPGHVKKWMPIQFCRINSFDVACAQGFNRLFCIHRYTEETRQAISRPKRDYSQYSIGANNCGCYLIYGAIAANGYN